MRPYAWCLAAAALFGASMPASKWLLDGGVHPVLLAGLLYLGAALATLPFVWTGGTTRRRDPKNMTRLGGAILFGGVLGPIALLFGLELAPSASVSLWLNVETTATALLAFLFFKEHLTGRTWLANILVVVAGVTLAAPNEFSFAPAALLVVAGCVCWGVDNNLTAIIDGYTPAQTTFAKGLAAGLFNVGLAFAVGAELPALVQVLAALVIGSLAYGASILLYIRGAQQLGATRSQMIFATAPFLGVALAWGLGEPMLGVQLAAGAILIAALALILSDRHGHAHAHPAQVHTHAHRHDDGHHDHRHPGLPDEAWHTHEHEHAPLEHIHPHTPDLHHRHRHG